MSKLKITCLECGCSYVGVPDDTLALRVFGDQHRECGDSERKLHERRRACLREKTSLGIGVVDALVEAMGMSCND